MPVPATIEVCEKYLFADVNEMAADGIPELIQQRLIRLRDMYNYWLQFPRKKDLEIVQELSIATRSANLPHTMMYALSSVCWVIWPRQPRITIATSSAR